MKIRKLILYITLTLVVLIFVGSCATTPEVQIWQPWTRILKNNISIPLESKLNIKVQGQTNALLGNEIFLQSKIKENLSHLLKRRGYQIEEENATFDVLLNYKTERTEKLTITSKYFTGGISTFKSTVEPTSYYGYGVNIARSISSLATQTTTAMKSTAESMTLYTHCISIEIFDKNKKLIWKGESTWDSDNLDLQTDIVPAIQLIISSLPTNNQYIPHVAEVIKGSESNYFDINCKNYWFACPALPYRLSFHSQGSSGYYNKEQIIDAKAFEAYLDLMQTAEYALPIGKEDIYENPLDYWIWSKVMLGGKYYLGPEKKLINVLIELKGTMKGYIVKKCWIASDSEYKDFEQKIVNWRNALIKYYDVIAQ